MCILQLYCVVLYAVLCCMLYALCCMLWAVCCVVLYAVCCMLCAVFNGLEMRYRVYYSCTVLYKVSVMVKGVFNPVNPKPCTPLSDWGRARFWSFTRLEYNFPIVITFYEPCIEGAVVVSGERAPFSQFYEVICRNGQSYASMSLFVQYGSIWIGCDK